MLLATVAAEAGFDGVLGEQRAMLRAIRRLGKGIYVDKSVAAPRSMSSIGFEVLVTEQWHGAKKTYVFRDRDARGRLHTVRLGNYLRFCRHGVRINTIPIT